MKRRPSAPRAPDRPPARSPNPATDPWQELPEWRLRQVTAGGRQFAVQTRPALPDLEAPDPSVLLLAELLKVRPADRVLVFNDPHGLAGVAAGLVAAQGQVWVANPHIVHVEAARKTVAANGCTNTSVYLSSGASHLPPDLTVDLVAAKLPKGKLPALQLIWDGFQALPPGGRFYLTGANDEGIKSYLQAVALLFGSVGVAGYRKGCRVGVAVKPEIPPALPDLFQQELLDHRHFHRFTVGVRGRELTLCARPGVFSWDRLDEGTRVLLETVEVDRHDTVLDLGCGCGVIGALAAQLAPEGAVYLVDAHLDAVESAQQTVAANQSPNCQVLVSDGAAAVREIRFDRVISNPPFHAGHATGYGAAWQFIREAHTILRRGGRLTLVANRFIPYEEVIRPLFGNVRALYQDNRYKVLEATR